MKTDLRGRRLGDRYALEEPLDAGGMAEVWRARDDVLGRDVAVKVLRQDLSKDEAIFDRFRREAVAAARLSHPSVVRVFDTGVDDGVCYIVMELVGGATLARRLQDGPMGPAEAVAVARPVLDALSHAHAAEIIHRDVKPGNVLIDDAGTVKVTDFGIAKAAFAGSDLTTTGKLLGTAHYLAPEQVTGGDVDGRTDLYAVGVVLYQMLTGQVPFDAETDLATATMRVTQDPPRPRTLRARIPRELDAVVMRALARKPADRYQSAQEMRSALDHVVPPSHAAPPPMAPHPRPPARGSFFRSWMAVPLAILALAAVAVGGGLLLGRLEVGGRFGVRLPGSGDQGGAAEARPLEIVAAVDHDPAGDGEEHPESAPAAIDDDPDSFWQTEGYNSADLGGAKSGVGLMLDLGAPQRVNRLTIRTTLPGWRFEVQGSDDGRAFTVLPSLDGEDRFGTEGPRTVVRLQEQQYRYLMVWIVRLAPDGGRFRATISDAEVEGG